MSTGLAEQPKRTLTLRDRLRDPNIVAEIGRALPSHCKPERMARVALTALTKNPKLANCTEASFFECLLSLSQWGLEPDGRHAHLIPRGNQCTLNVDYKGYVELVYRAGSVKKIHSDVVYEGDLFDWHICEVRSHVPWFLRRDAAKPASRGEIVGVYSQAWQRDGDPIAEVISTEDVEAIRKRSPAGRSGPWVTDWNEMAKKTAFRRLTKWLQLSPEIREVMDSDGDRFEPIAVVKPQPQAITDITAGLIADGERFTRTTDESQEETESTDGGVAGDGPETADMFAPSQSQDSTAAASYTPINRAKALGEFAEASSVTEVNRVLAAWRDFATEDDLAWLDKMSKSRRSELRK